MHLYNVRISVTKDGCKFTIGRFECQDTGKAYQWPNKLIKKTLLNKVDRLFYNQLSGFLGWYCWCLKEDIELCKEQLLGTCEKAIEKFESDLINIKKGMDNKLPDKRIIEYGN